MVLECIDCNNRLIYDYEASTCYYICIICNSYICDKCVKICNNCGFKFCNDCMEMKSITICNQTTAYCISECYELSINDLKTCCKCCLKYYDVDKTTGFCEDCSENIAQITYLQKIPIEIQNIISMNIYEV